MFNAPKYSEEHQPMPLIVPVLDEVCIVIKIKAVGSKALVFKCIQWVLHMKIGALLSGPTGLTGHVPSASLSHHLVGRGVSMSLPGM